MVFLTYNDAPDGIYFSQVLDVCRYWEDAFKERARLVAFISLRNFFVNKRKIKAAYPDSLVLPMYPGIENWKMNSFRLKLLLLFHKKETVIARGVFATLLALNSGRFRKVCFDARGAYAAEWEEYMKSYSPALAAKMKDLERDALTKADFRIAVSQKLVEYWKEAYSYSLSSHIVIPCTLDSEKVQGYSAHAPEIRKSQGIAEDEVLLVYSGSSAQWQSFNILNNYIAKAFAQNPKLRLLMLCKPEAAGDMISRFPGKVLQAWVKPNEVPAYLGVADYGLLVREPTVTNKVSSPVKFAEYLAAGLPVIISEGIGDYSSFVKERNCGMLVESVNWAGLKRTTPGEKQQLHQIALDYFSKAAHMASYKRMQQL